MSKAKSKFNPYLKEFLELLALAAIAILFRSVVYEPYVVPSTSMLPTTIVGDRILVQKFAYGISRYSFPLSPKIFSGRIFDFHKPQRGDVVVFETDKIYIKRLIGLPGDTVQMILGRLFINGKAVEVAPMKDFISENGETISQFVEVLPGGVKHEILDPTQHSYYDNTPVHRIPKDHYFFMGDNRDNSNDSRGDVGLVPYENILGKVETILFSSPDTLWYNPIFLFSLRTDRFFKKIQ